MNNLIVIDQISKSYYQKDQEIKVLDNISFTLKPKEIIAIVGSSGCGKSTLLSIISGLKNETKGTIIKKNNLILSFMFQTDALFKWLSVYDNILLPLKINNNYKNIDEIDILLTKYNLIDFKNNLPDTLSGGMRQRVALIRTMITNPDVLLLDEPFSALDYQTRIMIENDLYNLIKEKEKSAIIVTHDIAEAITISDKVIVLSKRPARIKKIIDIVDKPGNIIKYRSSSSFKKYYDLIWKELDHYE